MSTKALFNGKNADLTRQRRRADLSPSERRDQELQSRLLPGYMTPAALVARSSRRRRAAQTHPGKRGRR